MSVTRLATGPVHALRRALTGETLLPDDADYASARSVYNAMHDRWPALIVRAANTADVVRTVRFAAEEGAMLAVRGGNHSMRGHGSCDDGVVLDLAGLNTVEIDPTRRVARVGGGATWADVNAATHAHGLATTGGLISTTGVAGLTLGGGIGYLTRRLGLACDCLISADLVTAGGEQRTVDDAHDPELFWAIRGGGGNFGVVTAFTFRLAPIDNVVAGPLVFPADPEVLERYDAVMRSAPRELGAILGLTIAPPLPFLAPAQHGQPCAVVVACWSGAPGAAAESLAPLEAIGPLMGSGIRRMPYPEVNTLFDGLLPWGLRHYWKSTVAREIDAAAAARFVAHGRETPTIESGIFFYPVDGAAHDVGANDTAWPYRDARFVVGIHGSWHHARDDAALRGWVQRAHAACVSADSPAGYVNFSSDDDAPPTTLYRRHTARLVSVKRAWDRHNLFCLNANLDPDALIEA